MTEPIDASAIALPPTGHIDSTDFDFDHLQTASNSKYGSSCGHSTPDR